MIDSTISRGWLRRLACPGRFRFVTPGLTEASNLACALESRPGAAGRHPSVGDLVESLI